MATRFSTPEFFLARTRISQSGLVARTKTAFSVWRERQHLSRLDDHLLKDIGKSRAQAMTEADRAIWDAPDRWLR